jgi:hypothetical protein
MADGGIPLGGGQGHGIEDIRLAPHFWASPAFLLEKKQVWRLRHSWQLRRTGQCVQGVLLRR